MIILYFIHEDYGAQISYIIVQSLRYQLVEPRLNSDDLELSLRYGAILTSN